MSKICTPCNLKYSNSAHKCVNCGSELEIVQADAKRKRIFIASLIGIVLILVIVSSVIYFTGPRAKIKSIMRDFRQGDVDGVIACMPDFLIKSGDLSNDFIPYQLPNVIKTFSEYGFSDNVDKIASPSSKETNYVLTHLEYYRQYGYDPEDLQDIKVVIFSMKGVNPGYWFSMFEKFILIKYDGIWYWWPYNY